MLIEQCKVQCALTIPKSNTKISQCCLRSLKLDKTSSIHAINASYSLCSPLYSASFVEGRLDDHKAVYLDQTMAYLKAPFVDLGTTFTIACWVKLLPSNPYLKPILFSDNGGYSNGQFWFGIDADNKLLFENSITITSFRKEVDEPLHENLWLHVAVSLTTSNELLFYINGLKHLSSSISWQSPSIGPYAIGQFYIPSESKYVYFHGFLSDLYLFSRALSAEEIGKIMGTY